MLTLAAQVDPDWGFLAHLNAALNALALLLIIYGVVAIKQGREERHKKLMLAATAVSGLFLASYLLYHYMVGSVKYDGPVPVLYYTILIPHVVLAAVAGPPDRLVDPRRLARPTRETPQAGALHCTDLDFRVRERPLGLPLALRHLSDRLNRLR